MNDRYGWDDRNDSDRYRRHLAEGRQSSEGSYRSENQPSRGQERWRSEDDDWRSRSSFGSDRQYPDRQYRGRSDFDRGQRQGGSTFGYGEGRGGYGSGQSDYRQLDSQRRYTSSDYGYGPSQQGDGPPQPYFTGQQQAWEVPSSYGAPGTFGASYGGGTGTYGGGAGGSQGFGADYRDRSYGGGQQERGFLEKAGDEIASWFGDEDAARRREQDHRGRGPAGYTRSDERIREDANDRLTEDWRVDASSISVTVEAGEVTLNGTVARREDKRRAEDIVEDISGVKHVQNNLRVQQNTAWSGSSGTATTTGSSTTGTGTGSASVTATGAKDPATKDTAPR